jgi:hypothetical protein
MIELQLVFHLLVHLLASAGAPARTPINGSAVDPSPPGRPAAAGRGRALIKAARVSSGVSAG